MQPHVLGQDKGVGQHACALQALSNGLPVAYQDTLRIVSIEGGRAARQNAKTVTQKPPVYTPLSHPFHRCSPDIHSNCMWSERGQRSRAHELQWRRHVLLLAHISAATCNRSPRSVDVHSTHMLTHLDVRLLLHRATSAISWGASSLHEDGILGKAW